MPLDSQIGSFFTLYPSPLGYWSPLSKFINCRFGALMDGDAEDRAVDMLCGRCTFPNMLGFQKLLVIFGWGLVWCADFELCGGPTRTRTWDRPIMSRML